MLAWALKTRTVAPRSLLLGRAFASKAHAPPQQQAAKQANEAGDPSEAHSNEALNFDPNDEKVAGLSRLPPMLFMQ